MYAPSSSLSSGAVGTADRPVVLGALAQDRHAPNVVAAARQLADAHALRPVFVHITGGFIAHTLIWCVGTPYVEAPEPKLSERDAEATFAGWRRGVALFQRAGVPNGTDTYIANGYPPAAEIRDLARRLATAIIVVGRGRNRGRFRRVLGGSIAYALARSAPAPVLIVDGHRELGTGGPIVCEIADADSASLAAARSAAALARRAGQDLVLAHTAARGPEAPQDRDGAGGSNASISPRSVADVMADHNVENVVVEGATVPQLANLARRREADILVVGTNHEHPLKVLVRGSTSVDLLRRYDGPLLVVPSASPRSH
jgi:nucleotide-binding universal stress UspA family protein